MADQVKDELLFLGKESYFEVLGLAESTSDPKKIQDAVKDKSRWCNDLKSNPKHHAYIEALQPELKRIETLLLDKPKREQYLKDLKAYYKIQRKAKIKELEDLFRVYVGDGQTIAPGLLQQLYEKADELRLDRDEVDGLLADNGVSIGQAKPPPIPETVRQVRNPMDLTIWGAIRQDLEVLQKTSLYDLLELGRQAPADQIEQKRKDLKRQWDKKRHKDKGCWERLLAKVRTYLTKPDNRAKYDDTELWVREDAFEKWLRDSLPGVDRLTVKQRQVWIRYGYDQYGVEEQQGLAILDEVVDSLGVLFESGVYEPIPTSGKLRCPHCSRWTPEQANNCTHCARPIRVECLQCSASFSLEGGAAACPKCGFKLVDEQFVKSCRQEAVLLLRNQELEAAEQVVRQGLERFGDDQELKQLLAQVQKLLAQVQDERKQFDRVLTSVRQAASKLHWFEAHQLLAGVNRDSPEIEKLRREAQTRVAEARALLQQARDALQKKDRAAAVKLLHRITLEVHDCEEAARLLQGQPPPAPLDAKLALKGRQVRLRWGQPDWPIPLAGYQVVRKAGGPPGKPDDGDVLVAVEPGASPVTVAGDRLPQGGVEYHYAVYSAVDLGGKLCFTDAPVLLGPALYPRAVQEVKVCPTREGFVALSWSRPGSARVRIQRTIDREATGAEEGQTLAPGNEDALVDTTIEPDTTYFYNFFTSFQTTDGKIWQAKPVHRRFRAVALPPPVGALKARCDDQGVHLRWEPPGEQVEVAAVRLNEGSEPAGAGELLDARALEQLGSRLGSKPGEARDPVEVGGELTYQLFSVREDVAVAGAVAVVLALPDVQGLAVEWFGNSARLRWDWGPVRSVLVLLRRDADPEGPEDPRAKPDSFTRAAYDQRGYYEVPPEHQQSHVRIFSHTRLRNDDVYSAGTGSGVRCRVARQEKVRLKYQVSCKRKLFGKPKLSLQITADQPIELPPFRVVKKRGMIPLQATDGVSIRETQGPTPVPLSLELDSSHADGDYRIKIFFLDDSNRGRFEWVPASADAMRLG